MPVPNKIIVDFTNTKDSSGINPVHQKPGDYRGVIKSVDHQIAKTANKTPQLIYIIGDTDRPSATYRYNCPLTENSLWKIRNLLIASGIEVPKKRLNIAAIAQKIVGREIGMALDDDEYEGKLRSQIVQVMPVSELPADETTGSVDPEEEYEDDEEDDVEEEAPRRTRKAAATKAPAKKAPARKRKPAPVEEDEEDEDEDLEELDVDEL